jgi:hypothetical protein
MFPSKIRTQNPYSEFQQTPSRIKIKENKTETHHNQIA